MTMGVRTAALSRARDDSLRLCLQLEFPAQYTIRASSPSRATSTQTSSSTWLLSAVPFDIFFHQDFLGGCSGLSGFPRTEPLPPVADPRFIQPTNRRSLATNSPTGAAARSTSRIVPSRNFSLHLVVPLEKELVARTSPLYVT